MHWRLYSQDKKGRPLGRTPRRRCAVLPGRAGRGEEEMTSQKGVVTAPGRRPGTSVLRGGARRGRGVGALTDPPPLARETAGAGTQRAKAGTGWLPLPAALRALWPRRVPSPGLTRDPGVLQTGGPDSRKTGDRGPRGRLPVPRAGARRVQGRVSVFFLLERSGEDRQSPGRA